MKHILIGYMRDGKGGIDHYIEKFVFELLSTSDACEIDIITSYDVDVIKNIFKEHNNIHVLKVHTLKHIYRQYKDFINIFERKQYDIAYFNISEASNCNGVRAAHKKKVPRVIVHSHSAGIDVENSIKRGIRKLVHSFSKNIFISRCANEYVACSDKAAQWMFSKKICQNKEYISIFNEIDFEKFSFDSKIREEYRDKLGVQNKLVVGAVGAFSYQKNNIFFVDIVEELVKRRDDICFIAIGEGTILERTKAYAENKCVADKMMFMGQRSDVSNILMAMDIFIMPSRFEGLPFAAVEAQATGLRCLLSSNISKDTKISDGCEFIDGFKPDKWADCIINNLPYERNKLVNDRNIIFRTNNEFISTFVE